MDGRYKVTVKIRSLWTPWTHVRGMKVQLHASFMSAPDGRELSATHSRRFAHRNTARGKKKWTVSSGLRSRNRHIGEDKRFITPAGYWITVPMEPTLYPNHYTDWANPYRKQTRLWHNFIFCTIPQIYWTDWEKQWNVAGYPVTRLQNRSTVSLSRNERNCLQYTACARMTHRARVPICQQHLLFRKLFWCGVRCNTVNLCFFRVSVCVQSVSRRQSKH
jgi:hypothetical protein